MTTATQQANIPTWKEVIGNSLLVEYELKFDVNFSQRKHILFLLHNLFRTLFFGVFSYDVVV